MEVPLANGKGVALVDDEDWELVSKYSWYMKKGKNSNYALTCLKINKKKVHLRMHRLVLNAPEDKFVDHIDRNGLNNRKENLRLCTKSQNGCNKPPLKGYKGVYYSTRYHAWAASVTYGGVRYHLSHYYEEVDAARCYDIAAKILQGPFAYLNFPENNYDEFVQQSLTEEVLSVVGKERQRLNGSRKEDGTRRGVTRWPC